MAGGIKIQHAAPPWQPTDDSEVVQTFVRYDFPRVGVVSQGPRRFLFGCVDEIDSLTLWAYVELTDADERSLLETPDRAVEHFEMATRPISLAMAREDDGIVLSTPFAPVAGVTFVDAVVASTTAAAGDLLAQRRLYAPQ
ncbi:MAG: hypothetical protein M3323_14350 [Actinomycetota bacterium]|nr:hypothetical protein [Actinomycetota bacterium]